MIQREIGQGLPGGPGVKTSPSSAGGMGSIHRGLRSHTSQDQNIKQQQYGNRFNKEFKNGPHQKKFF